MKKPRLDFKLIAARALGQIDAICTRWLPEGKRAGSEWEIGDRHGNPGKSLKVHLTGTKAGMWSDFSAGDKGGDLISLVAYVDGCSPLDAARKLAAFLGMPEGDASPQAVPDPAKRATKPAPEWTPILPVPADAQLAPVAHPRNGRPDRTYSYRGPSGELLGYVARWEANETRPKKEFGWLVFAQADIGRREWRWMGFPIPRPLYGLEALAARPSAAVVLTEGEKACEAARELLPDHVALTWPGGSKAADKAGFGPLQGRGVILWADADEPGKSAMQAVTKLLRKAGVKSIHWLNLPALAAFRDQAEGGTGTTPTLPPGFDAADLLAEGWDAARMTTFLSRPDALLDARTRPVDRPGERRLDAAEMPMESRFTVTDAGLFYFEPGRDGQESRQVRVADRIEITALARDEESVGWAAVLAFKNMDGNLRQEIIPRRLFLGDSTDGLKQLADLGLSIEPGRAALDRLKHYIASARPAKRARLVDANGWHGFAYLFPDGAIGDTDETLVYRGSRQALGVFTPRGKLKDWQKNIAALAVENPRLLFTLAAAFSGPLLKLCGGASSAFHWIGMSSSGKSGALAAAGSIWGHPQRTVHSWRSTDNSLEYVAAQHNDGLLILDELKEVDPKQAGSIAYMLGNSKGKNRAHQAGGLREAMTWRIVMLSSGEIGLADLLTSVGQKTHTGQTVRFIELSADAGERLGMWNNLHHLEDGRAFTDHLKEMAAKYHGTAGREFIAALIERAADVPATAKEIEAHFFNMYCPADAGGQVRRVAAAFVLVAAAGELAAGWEICPWPRHSAISAAGEMFREWLKERPTTGNLEEAQILAHVRQLMERSWQSKFIDWHRVKENNADLSRMAAVVDSLGFRRDMAKKSEDTFSHQPHEANFHYYVTRERFRDEFASKASFNYKRVAAVLRDLGILKCDEDGSTWRETLPNGDSRSYCIIGKKLWEAAEND